MIEETIEKLEERVRSAPNLKGESRSELIELLATLKQEIGSLAATHAEEAESIAGFTAVSAHEATRSEPDPELVQLSLQGLSKSVLEFESSHPRMVQAVNSICSALSNLGI